MMLLIAIAIAMEVEVEVEGALKRGWFEEQETHSLPNSLQ
jgi:hypothetical protein